MPLGQSIGNQYIFEPMDFGQLPIDGRSSGEVNTGMPSIGKPQTNLEAKDDLVENYLNNWANLNSIAKHAMKRYGVDITAPDLSNPTEQRLGRMFPSHDLGVPERNPV